jgi:transcriptional regulator with XRE-family HTH domain
MRSQIKPVRLHGLPEAMRRQLKEARLSRGWSQVELGRRVGLPQMHISGIESGKIAPRFNTLLDLVRVLDYDLPMVPRALVPAVQALIRGYRNPERSLYADHDEQPLYASVSGEGERPDDEV